MQRISLEEFFLIAEAVIGRRAEEMVRASSIARAEAALAAPFMAYEGIELYPPLHEKAAVLASRLVRSRPLPDGNKRVAFVCTVELIERNGARLRLAPAAQDALATTIERLMLGQCSERELAAWLQERIQTNP